MTRSAAANFDAAPIAERIVYSTGGFVVAGQKFQLSQLRVDGVGIYAAEGRKP